MNLKNKLILAPLAGITNLPFRLLCKHYGADLTFTEMVSAKGYLQKNKTSKALTKTLKQEKPVGIQFFGNNPEEITKAAALVEKKFDIIDINLGCPVPKVIKTGAGAILLKDKKKIFEIINSLKQNIKKPISAKIRFHKNMDETVKIAKTIEDAGASFITIHPRTIDEGYFGKIRISAIKKIKESVSIPVIGNGDIKKPKDITNMQNKTNCDSVMIGRAAIGNPYFFRQCANYLKTNELLPQQTSKERIDDFFKFIKLAKKCKTEFNLRQFTHFFTIGLEGSRKIRQKVNTMKDEEIINMIKSI